MILHHQSRCLPLSLLTAALAAIVRLVLGLIFFPIQDEPWPTISRVNLKMLFEVLTDKEVEELKKSDPAAEFLRDKPAAVGSRGAIPGDGQAGSVAVCAV